MAVQVDLPDELPDVTATELHVAVLHRLLAALRHVFGDRALVIGDVFLRVDHKVQVSPDVMIVPGAAPGTRRVYHVPDEPVPDVTIEVLSLVNRIGVGRRLLQQKRDLLGAIGVPFHLEIDPDRGVLTVWRNVGGRLVVGPPGDRYDGPELGGLRIALEPGRVHLQLPGGRPFIDVSHEIDRGDREAMRADEEAYRAALAAHRAAVEARRADEEARRADEEARRADEEARRADGEAQRAERLAGLLREAGIDPDQ